MKRCRHEWHRTDIYSRTVICVKCSRRRVSYNAENYPALVSAKSALVLFWERAGKDDMVKQARWFEQQQNS